LVKVESTEQTAIILQRFNVDDTLRRYFVYPALQKRRE